MSNILRISNEKLNVDELIQDLNSQNQQENLVQTFQMIQPVQNPEKKQEIQDVNQSGKSKSKVQQNSHTENTAKHNKNGFKSPSLNSTQNQKLAQSHKKGNQSSVKQDESTIKMQNVKSSGCGSSSKQLSVKGQQVENPNENKNSKNMIQPYSSIRDQHFTQRKDSQNGLQKQDDLQSLQIEAKGLMDQRQNINENESLYNMTISTQKGTNLNNQYSISKISNACNNNFVSNLSQSNQSSYKASSQRQNLNNPASQNRYQEILEANDEIDENEDQIAQNYSFSENLEKQSIQTFNAQIQMEENLDNENFTQKLDQMILNFRTETMQEFIKTKGRMNHQKEQTIDAERRRCNTLLNAKQNEIEQLKEKLTTQSNLAKEYSLRCEILALWSGEGKTLARMKVFQIKAFQALKDYHQFKKHSKNILLNKSKTKRILNLRNVFQAWYKNFKVAKIQRDKEKFDNAVKKELQSISAQYQKEIETLRQKLNEAERTQSILNRNKHIMQENLKKVFMRSVCALNFEAMSILDPAEQGNAAAMMQREIEKQVQNAMMIDEQQMNFGTSFGAYPPPPRSEVSFNLSENNDGNQFNTQRNEDKDFYPIQTNVEKEMLNMALNQELISGYKTQTLNMDNAIDPNYRKIESKDSLWKPAPVMGREMTMQNYNQINERQECNTFFEQQEKIQQNALRKIQQELESQQTITQKLQQIRGEAAQISASQQLFNGKSNSFINPSQFEQMRKDQKYDELMAQINQKQEENEKINKQSIQSPFQEDQQKIQASNSNSNFGQSLPQVTNQNSSSTGKAIYVKGTSIELSGHPPLPTTVKVSGGQMKTTQPKAKAQSNK